MKNHIAFKFLAVLLCALTLLGSFVCILGIAGLEANDLYESDVPSMEEDYRQRLLSSAAHTVLGKYAATTLSNCPERLLEEYYGNYQYNSYLVEGAWFYTLIGPDGTVLGSDVPTHRSDLVPYIFEDLGTWYIELVDGPVESEQEDRFGDHMPMVSPTTPDTLSYPTERPSATDPTVAPLDEPTQPPTGIYTFTYWDYETDGYVEARIRDARIDGYTVVIHANDASFEERSDWALLTLAWNNRYNIITALVILLLLFAIGAVYLCTAAGRNPGSDEIRAGGFNALPMDFYTMAVVFLTFLTYEVVDEFKYWFDYSNFVFFWFLLFAGFFVCLLFVGWCFAWAAQIKEGNGRWWRKSLIGYGCRIGWWLLKSLVTVFCPGLALTLWRIIKAIFRFIRSVLTVVWETFRNAALWVWRKVTGAFWWIGCKVERVFSLLPVTWQWILVGFALVAILFLGIVNAMNRYDPMGLLVSIGLCLAVVLYGAHAFGLLLEAVKKMRQGDLDNQVSDRLLLGAFRDFAGELNGLADVAKVAAQMEMKSERMKTELITNVSHDIKTPLTSIINYVDLLQKPHTEDEEREYLEVLGRKSQQLKKLIQDLMEMSKASTGNMAADIRRVDAVEAVNQALGEYADKLAAAELTPVVKAPESPVWMKADGRLTWRVLNNLLGNAAKYALPGTRLYVDLARQNGYVLISLKNVSAQELNVDADELMERFVRGDAARNSEGSGLGLNIAKSLMEVQNGQLVLTVDGDLFKATLILPEG